MVLQPRIVPEGLVWFGCESNTQYKQNRDPSKQHDYSSKTPQHTLTCLNVFLLRTVFVFTHTERCALSLCFSVISSLFVCCRQLSPVPSAVTRPSSSPHAHLVAIYHPRSLLLTSRPSTKPVPPETSLHPGSPWTATIIKPHPLHSPKPTLPPSSSLPPSPPPLLS